MKRTYKLENLGCANCANKMETAIKKLDNIQEAKINFFTCKLSLEGDLEKEQETLEKIQKEIKKIERDCKIVY